MAVNGPDSSGNAYTIGKRKAVAERKDISFQE